MRGFNQKMHHILAGNQKLCKVPFRIDFRKRHKKEQFPCGGEQQPLTRVSLLRFSCRRPRWEVPGRNRLRMLKVEMQHASSLVLFQQHWWQCRTPSSEGARHGKKWQPPSGWTHRETTSDLCLSEANIFGLGVKMGANMDAYFFSVAEPWCHVPQLEPLTVLKSCFIPSMCVGEMHLYWISDKSSIFPRWFLCSLLGLGLLWCYHQKLYVCSPTGSGTDLRRFW